MLSVIGLTIMPEAKLKVKLLAVTPQALDVIYSAFRQCYSPKYAADILKEKISQPAKEKFVKKVLASGHESPLEHVSFTFSVAGISRVLTHQLVRHRIASFSQQSQRYVKAEKFSYIVPPLMRKYAYLGRKFSKIMRLLSQEYKEIISFLESQGVKGEAANQDARFILPQATETKIVVTMNCRELLHFFELRCCTRAQWEIRALAYRMLAICKRELPAVFATAGPKCIKLGYCPEGKFSCGRYPRREDVIRGHKSKR